MKQEERKHILLCVAGGTPQVITETLYALTQVRGERVDEVRVITTPRGQEEILGKLLHPEHGKFSQFCNDYGIAPATIRFDRNTITLLATDAGEVLNDLISDDENQAAIDHICRIVRGLTQDRATRLHASVGGGRKTMSIALTMAMQLFGRTQDQLSHVLVAREYESHPRFYYPRPQPEDLFDRDGQSIATAAWVSLAEISFIRLGGVLSDWLSEDEVRYRKLVELAQDALAVRGGKMRLHLAEERISVANRSIDLPGREFFIYVLLALCCRKNNGAGLLRLGALAPSHLEETLRLIAPLRNPELFNPGEQITLADAEEIPGYGFLATLLDHVESRDVLKLETTFNQVRSKVNKKLKAQTLPENFQIRKKDKKGNAAFGLEIPPANFILIKPRPA